MECPCGFFVLRFYCCMEAALNLIDYNISNQQNLIMSVSAISKNKHLLWRMGFGPSLNDLNILEHSGSKALFKNILKVSENYEAIQLARPADFSGYKAGNATAEMKKEYQKVNNSENNEIITDWCGRMVNGAGQLREKMAFFWNGHFATKVNRSALNLQLLNTIRENALGNFGDLLFAVSKSPAMLQFLNNQQNKKGHPNENFAREVMELFTMGRGNYTEQDIKEAARAFTGWSFTEEGGFFERPNAHDTGMKTFLGHTGNFDGNDILKIILEQKATARFITAKIYRFFVNETLDEVHVNRLAEKFYHSGYDIKNLMSEIFTSGWFYDEKNIGAKIKSPVELLTGIQRILPVGMRNPNVILVYQRLLGQLLLSPPNVAGWPSGKSWIDSSTLMLRLKIPQIWSGIISMDYTPKDDDDMNMGMRKNLPKELLGNFKIDWATVESAMRGFDPEQILLERSASLPQNVIDDYSGTDMVKRRIIAIMSSPEYQLC